MSKIIITNARLSFPSLFETEMYNGTDTGKYAATFLLDKKIHKDKILEIKKAMVAAAEAKFGSPVPKSVVYSLKDGDDVDTDGYAGNYSLKASTKKRPTVVNRDKSPIAAEDDVMYAGCYVNASIDIWVMDNQYGKKVLFNLKGVQFSKEGEAFGTNNNSALSDFEELESEADDVDPFA